MKKLPTGRQNFAAIIKENLLYVDKTRQIFELIDSGNLYFLPRPRRFGKSLLLSTLKQLFRGKKKLFKGLYIAEKTNYKWPAHPVLHFNFAALGHKTLNLEVVLIDAIQEYAKEFKVKITNKSLSAQVKSLVKKIAKKTGKPVVFLVDEYDKPIIDWLTNKTQAKSNQVILRDFFSPLKTLEEKGYLHFLFITGVSKFSKVSIFSDLNNLTDLTIHQLSHDLLGITKEELLTYFDGHIQQTSQKLNLSKERLLEGVKLRYDGYSYDGTTFLYNPYSLLNFFGSHRFGNFWFSTGTPTFLVETIRNEKILPTELEDLKVAETFFDKFNIDNLDIYSLLFQTGYLTIKSVQLKGFNLRYTLGYPNEEVQLSFIHGLLEAFTYRTTTIVSNALVHIEQALEEGQVEVFIQQLKILLSDVSYHLLPKKKQDPTQEEVLKNFEMWEGYFHTVIYLITSFLGFSVQAEVTRHKGRLDLIAETTDFLYIMEFKLDESAEDAIAQIKSRKYAMAYKNSVKRIILVGIGFSKKERNVESWEKEEW